MARVRFGAVVREVDAILFDKDGTLLDAYVLWHAMADGRLRALGESDRIGPEVLAACEAQLGYDRATRRVDPRGPLAVAPQTEEIVINAAVVYRMTGIPWTEAKALVEGAYARAEERLRARIDDVSSPLPGIREALVALRAAGVRLGVATTDVIPRSESMLRVSGLLEHFDFLGGRDLVKRGKPHPDLALLVCERLGVEPGRVAIVGDSPEDLLLGRNAGLGLRVGVLTGSGTPENLGPLADVVIGSVAEIRPE